MTTLSKEVRAVITLAIVVELMIYSRITVLPLMALAIGAVMTVLGIAFASRLSSFMGLVVICVTAASSTELPSLLELDMTLKALIALVIPILLLTWLTLTAEAEENQNISLRNREAAISLGYAFVCIWSVPIVVLVMSLFVPTISMRITTMTEAAIMVITAIAGGILLTRRRPMTAGMPARTETTTEGQ